MAQTTAFQYEALAAVAALEDPSGQDIARYMQRSQNPTSTELVNHGRLYPNLNGLVSEGLLIKGERNKRTNYYRLSDSGIDKLESRKSLLSGPA